MPASVDINSESESLYAGDAAYLQLKLEGKTLGRCALNQPRITMGRSSSSDIVLDATSGISRDHAHILIIDGEAVIEDLGSRNGTLVNGRPCKRRTLKPGDRIAIGRYRLRFRRARPAKSASGQDRVTALLRLWQGAAITIPPEGCPRCRADHTDETGDGRDDTQTDAVLRLVDPAQRAAVTQSSNPAPTQDPATGDDPRRSTAIPSGVADAGDTVSGINFPFFF